MLDNKMSLDEAFMAIENVLNVELTDMQLMKERQLRNFCEVFGIYEYKGHRAYFNQLNIVFTDKKLYDAIKHVRSDYSSTGTPFKIEMPDYNIYLYGMSYLNDHMLQEALFIDVD